MPRIDATCNDPSTNGLRLLHGRDRIAFWRRAHGAAAHRDHSSDDAWSALASGKRIAYDGRAVECRRMAPPFVAVAVSWEGLFRLVLACNVIALLAALS